MRHSFTTRFLSSIMPSKNFAAKDATLDDMASFMVSDLRVAFFDGVRVSWPLFLVTLLIAEVAGATYHFAFIGIKGDWPYLRKVMKLVPGFTSKRKCHHGLCSDACSHGNRKMYVALPRNGGSWDASDASRIGPGMGSHCLGSRPDRC